MSGDNTIISKDEFLKFEKSLGGMIERALSSQVISMPSPHIFLSDFVDEFVRDILVSQVNKSQEFLDVEGGGTILSEMILSNPYWSLYDSYIKKTLWSLLPKFSQWFDEKETDLIAYGMTCKRLRYYPSFISYTKPSRGIPPHVDGASSVLTALTLLGYLNGEKAPVTNFFKPTDHGFTQISSYMASRRSLFVWMNLPDSWHGVIEPVNPCRLTHLASLESFEINIL